MLTEREKVIIASMPKAENHIHIEGSIPWRLAIELAKKNHVEIPFYEEAEIGHWAQEMIRTQGLNGFMICNRTFNAACVTENDYEAVIIELAKQASAQNIIYQEYHLDYPLSEERGISMETVMNGYARGREIAKRDYGVDIVFIAGIDRTQPPEKCLSFVRALKDYRPLIEGLGLDCEEQGYPARLFTECYREGKKLGLFLTAHAGEDSDASNITDSLNLLQVNRIDHGCRAAEQPKLQKRLKDEQILCAMCPTSNIGSGAAKSLHDHPFLTLFRAGVPVSISSDDPPYVNSLNEEYEKAITQMGLTLEELVQIARNAFAYSIRGQKYLPRFDAWMEANGFLAPLGQLSVK